MQEASFEGILKTVLIVLLVYFGFKILIRFFGPMILKYFLKKVGSKFQQQFNQQTSSRPQKEGEVVLEKKPENRRKTNKTAGEYIDYEEID